MNPVLKNGFVAYDIEKEVTIRCDLKCLDGVLYADGAKAFTSSSDFSPAGVDAYVVLGEEIPRDGGFLKVKISAITWMSQECYEFMTKWNLEWLTSCDHLRYAEIGVVQS